MKRQHRMRDNQSSQTVVYYYYVSFINKSGTFRARYLLNRTNYNNRINSYPPHADTHTLVPVLSEFVLTVAGCVDDSHEMWRQSRDVATVTGCGNSHGM